MTETGTTSTAHPTTQAVTRLLVPLDGTSMSVAALRVAARLAPRLGVPVSVVDCVRPPFTPEWERDWVVERAAEVGLTVDRAAVVHESANVVDEILATAATVPGTAVCLASHGRSAVGELLVGSVTHGVIVGSPTAVLVVGPRASMPTSFDTVQVAYDGSPPSRRAVDAGVAWASQLHATPWLTEVVTPDPELLEGLPSSDVLESSTLHRMADALDAAGIEVQWDVLHGDDPAGSLAHWARNQRPGILVVGSHGRSARQRLFIGSVMSRLIAEAPCPVLVTGPAFEGPSTL